MHSVLLSSGIRCPISALSNCSFDWFGGGIRAAFSLGLVCDFISHTTDHRYVSFKQIHQLHQRGHIHHGMVRLANVRTDHLIEHPTWDTAPRAVGQSRHQHVGPFANDFQSRPADIEKRMIRIQQFPKTDKAGSVQRVSWSAPTNRCRQNTISSADCAADCRTRRALRLWDLRPSARSPRRKAR